MTNRCRFCNGSRASLHAARDLAILACVCAALALAAIVGAVAWAGEE